MGLEISLLGCLCFGIRVVCGFCIGRVYFIGEVEDIFVRKFCLKDGSLEGFKGRERFYSWFFNG